MPRKFGWVVALVSAVAAVGSASASGQVTDAGAGLGRLSTSSIHARQALPTPPSPESLYDCEPPPAGVPEENFICWRDGEPWLCPLSPEESCMRIIPDTDPQSWVDMVENQVDTTLGTLHGIVDPIADDVSQEVGAVQRQLTDLVASLPDELHRRLDPVLLDPPTEAAHHQTTATNAVSDAAAIGSDLAGWAQGGQPAGAVPLAKSALGASQLAAHDLVDAGEEVGARTTLEVQQHPSSALGGTCPDSAHESQHQEIACNDQPVWPSDGDVQGQAQGQADAAQDPETTEDRTDVEGPAPSDESSAAAYPPGKRPYDTYRIYTAADVNAPGGSTQTRYRNDLPPPKAGNCIHTDFSNPANVLMRWGAEGRFGLRKIKDKHDWDAETRQALPNTIWGIPNSRRKVTYEGGCSYLYEAYVFQQAPSKYYGCQYQVAVDYRRLSDGQMFGIVTAFVDEKTCPVFLPI